MINLAILLDEEEDDDDSIADSDEAKVLSDLFMELILLCWFILPIVLNATATEATTIAEIHPFIVYFDKNCNFKLKMPLRIYHQF